MPRKPVERGPKVVWAFDLVKHFIDDEARVIIDNKSKARKLCIKDVKCRAEKGKLVIEQEGYAWLGCTVRLIVDEDTPYEFGHMYRERLTVKDAIALAEKIIKTGNT